MPEVDFVLVQPLYEGNVGFAARAIKNFGFSRLVLVDPCPLGDDAIARAGHAKDVLESASRLTLDEVFSGSDLVIATTGEVSKSICNPMRMPYYSPREIRSLVEPHRGKVSLLFGRENRPSYFCLQPRRRRIRLSRDGTRYLPAVADT